jgi:hypothetical protein
MGNFSCNKCTQSFSTYFELREHKESLHKEDLAEEMPAGAKKRFG